MRNIKIILEYDGLLFKGWQKQTGKTVKTVQGEVEKVLSSILSEEIEIVGSRKNRCKSKCIKSSCKF